MSPADAHPRWWRDSRRRRILAAADGLTGAALGLGVMASAGAETGWGLIGIPVILIGAKLLGLYDRDHRSIRHLTADEVPAIGALIGATVITLMLITPGVGDLPSFPWLLVSGVLVSVCLRAAARWVWRRTTPLERTLIIGHGEAARAIRRKVELFPDMHMRLAAEIAPEDIDPANGHEPLEQVLQGIDRVVIAWAEADPALIERLVAVCRQRQAKLSVVSPFKGAARPNDRVSMVADLPLLEYNTWDAPRSTMFIKRLFDISLSLPLVLLLSPLFLAIALAVKLDSRGPVFFRQVRAGRHGDPFNMLKFRSMVVDAEERLDDLIDLDALDDPMFKLRGDPRVTRVGRFLRRYSLDELPQLINVLRGEMSIVGPRPEELAVVARYTSEHKFRLELTPGLTGPMQVYGRGELTFKERLAVELDYLENLSVLRDMHLLFLTLPAVFKGRGAF